MKRETVSKMFLAGAIFNWGVGAMLFFIPGAFLSLLAVTPTPEQSLWIQQFAGLVFMFGIGYYWASRDFQANVQIIRMGIIGKVGVALIGLLNVATGDVSWQFMFPASVDVIFAVLFIMALKALPTWRAIDEI